MGPMGLMTAASFRFDDTAFPVTWTLLSRHEKTLPKCRSGVFSDVIIVKPRNISGPTKTLKRKRKNIMKTMQPRMKNPAMIIPDAMEPIQALYAATQKGEVPPKTLALVHLRVSQINGCSFCIDGGACEAKKAGETDDRLFTVAAWREAPYFTDAERAALALAEAVTRLSDRSDPVPDDIWDEATRHYEEPALAALILAIATTNVFNRLNVTTRQIAGSNPWTDR
jgi:AhpD family alkylhydroperoxidase